MMAKMKWILLMAIIISLSIGSEQETVGEDGAEESVLRKNAKTWFGALKEAPEFDDRALL